jgi:hypothetical protein
MLSSQDSLFYGMSIAILFLVQISSAMSVSSPSECAVVGCGVLGTSLCKQMLESPEFASWKGKAIEKQCDACVVKKEIDSDYSFVCVCVCVCVCFSLFWQ